MFRFSNFSFNSSTRFPCTMQAIVHTLGSENDTPKKSSALPLEGNSDACHEQVLFDQRLIPAATNVSALASSPPNPY